MNHPTRKRWSPHFRQTPERKAWEVEVAKRAIRMACERADYCINIATYALVDVQRLAAGANPRSVISSLRGQVSDAIKSPEYEGFLSFTYADVQDKKRAGIPEYCSREARVRVVDKMFRDYFPSDNPPEQDAGDESAIDELRRVVENR